MSILARPDIRDIRPALPAMDWAMAGIKVSSLRVALHTDAGAGAATDPEVLAAVEAVAEVFAAAGATVERIAAFIDQDMMDGLDNFWRTRSWADYQALPAGEQEKVLPYIAQWCAGGAGSTAPTPSGTSAVLTRCKKPRLGPLPATTS